LQLDSGSQGLAGRAEHAQGLVTPELDELTAASEYGLAGQLREYTSQPTGLLVAVLLCEARITANVGDQEGENGWRE
jgi:hypothetical protein